MSDAGLRALEQRWRETRAIDDEARYLQALVRAGQLSPARLRVAALAGEPAAMELEPGVPPGEFDAWLDAVAAVDWPDDAGHAPAATSWSACLRALLGACEALARPLYNECEGMDVYLDFDVVHGLELARGCLLEPSASQGQACAEWVAQATDPALGAWYPHAWAVAFRLCDAAARPAREPALRACQEALAALWTIRGVNLTHALHDAQAEVALWALGRADAIRMRHEATAQRAFQLRARARSISQQLPRPPKPAS